MPTTRTAGTPFVYPSGCSVDGCEGHLYGRGLCNKHWQRWRRHGDPLGGGPSKGDLLKYVLEVAIHFTGEGCLTWPYGRNLGGYGRLTVDGNDVLASRYVCTLVHGEPPTPEHHAAHNCGKGHEGCVAPGHLEWKTAKANHEDRIAHGTHNRGETHGQAKLTEAQVREILRLKGARTTVSLAHEFGVSRWSISDIQSRRKWAWVSVEEGMDR